MCSLNGWLHTCAEEPTGGSLHMGCMSNAWILLGHCTLIPYQFNGIVLVQRSFIVIANSVHCIRIGIKWGRSYNVNDSEQWRLITGNVLINNTSARTICNVTSQFQVCRCYDPFICWGTSNTVASHESRRFILPTIRLLLKSLFWLTAHETSEN